MSVSACVVWFMAFSLLGWVYETIYCTIKEQSWQNRGFLYGPICPIYGAGAMAAILTCSLLNQAGIQLEWWHVFLITCLGSMPLEYGTHWALEAIFDAYWWDYSNMPLNLNGRICLPASLLFGAGGLLVYFVLFPFAQSVNAHIPSMAMDIMALVFVALLSVDATLTVSALTQFAQAAKRIETTVDERMTQWVESAVATGQNISEQRERLTSLTRREIAEQVGVLARTSVTRVKGFRVKGADAATSQLEALRNKLRARGERKNR